PKDQTSGALLRTGESRDSGFDASHRPGMTGASTRAIGAGDGVAFQRRNFAGPEAFGDAGEACLIQLPVDPLGRLVRPTDHGEPTQGACKCDQRRHRSILVLHVSAPRLAFSPKAARPAIGMARDQMARPALSLTARIWPKLP